MPILIHYEPEQNVLYSKAIGVIFIEDIMGYYSKIERMDLKPGYSVLADYSEAVSDLIYDEIVAMVERQRHLHRGLRPAKIAIVAKSDIMFGLARVYAAMIEPENIEVNVFRDRTQALQWLEISESHRKINEHT